MKKIAFTLFLLTFVSVSAGWSAVQEKPATAPLATHLIQGKVPAGDVSFEVSVSPGKWTQAKVGQLFTTGYQPSDFSLPALKENPVPIRYPRWAVQEGWQGTFVIAIEVLQSGEVGRWKVMQSTGYSLLDETAAKTIRQWHFHPGIENGQAVVMCIQVPVRFELRDTR